MSTLIFVILRCPEYINLYDNRLTGTIPNNLGLRDLFYFDIGRNYIGGSIPADIGTDFTELRYLHVDHNRLTQGIPYTIPPMADGRLVSFLADHNRLTGVVPDNWIMFNKLVQYTLHGKQMLWGRVVKFHKHAILLTTITYTK